MKKIIITLGLSLLAIPTLVGAHGMLNFSEVQTGPQMMQYIEDQILGDELHEEMEDLMIKMMQNDLSQQEANRLSELMQQYPGPHGMMMNRVWNDYNNTAMRTGLFKNTWGMHSGYGGIGWFGFIGMIVWIIVGVMLIIFLGAKIGKEK